MDVFRLQWGRGPYTVRGRVPTALRRRRTPALASQLERDLDRRAVGL